MTQRATTLAVYRQNFNRLIRVNGDNKVINILKLIESLDVSPSTRLTYAHAMLHHQDELDGDIGAVTVARDNWQRDLDTYRAESNITERQREALSNITSDDIKSAVARLERDKYESIKAMESYLILKLMSEHPPRNDLSDIPVVIGKAPPKNGNVVSLPKNGEQVIIIRDHKTSQSRGTITIPLDAGLVRDIKWLFTTQPTRKYLFETTGGVPLSSSVYTHRLNTITRKELGYPISSTILRKIYLTGKYGGLVSDQASDAKMMGHSVETQKTHYISNDKEVNNSLSNKRTLVL